MLSSVATHALKTVNQELVGLYWDIGRMIVERQAVAGWGKAVVEQLAADLQMEFPGVGGFSASNLWRMKAFFEAYNGLEKLAPLVREIAWSHNLAIMNKCKDPLEREFYIRMTRRFGWSRNVLIHQIESQSYEKSLLGQTNFDRALTPELRAQAKLAVKDPYTFDFLELGEAHSERELERLLITRIEDFLRAMGGMFAFMGSQYRLEVDGKAFFIDLLLFHRRLRCLVAIELKIGEFMPEFIGKMQFYLTALDRQVRHQANGAQCRATIPARPRPEAQFRSPIKPITSLRPSASIPSDKGYRSSPAYTTKVLSGATSSSAW